MASARVSWVLDLLAVRLEEGEIEEVILATNATVEGEVTARYIHDMADARGIKTTRIAQGVPDGLAENLGNNNSDRPQPLAHAFAGRSNF